jgi:hypothetical protein
MVLLGMLVPPPLPPEEEASMDIGTSQKLEFSVKLDTNDEFRPWDSSSSDQKDVEALEAVDEMSEVLVLLGLLPIGRRWSLAFVLNGEDG